VKTYIVTFVTTIYIFTAIENNVSKDNPKAIIARVSQTYHPINLNPLTVDHFINFLLSLKTPGEYLSKNRYGGIRSSLFDLFHETKIKSSEDFRRKGAEPRIESMYSYLTFAGK